MPLDALDSFTLPAGAPALDLPLRFLRRPHLLANALATTKLSAPNLAKLADFILPRTPRCPLASDSLHTGCASSAPELLDTAVGMPWMSFNNASWTNAITTDCDHDEAEDLVAEFMRFLRQVDPDAPEPLIVVDWWTGRSHVTWFLGKPVFTGPQPDASAGRSAPVLRTLEAVRLGLCAVLRGDPGFTNRLTKNPFARGTCHPGRGRPALPLLWDWYADTGCPMRFRTIQGDLRPIGLLSLWRALKLWREDTGQALPFPGAAAPGQIRPTQSAARGCSTPLAGPSTTWARPTCRRSLSSWTRRPPSSTHRLARSSAAKSPAPSLGSCAPSGPAGQGVLFLASAGGSWS